MHINGNRRTSERTVNNRKPLRPRTRRIINEFANSVDYSGKRIPSTSMTGLGLVRAHPVAKRRRLRFPSPKNDVKEHEFDAAAFATSPTHCAGKSRQAKSAPSMRATS